MEQRARQQGAALGQGALTLDGVLLVESLGGLFLFGEKRIKRRLHGAHLRGIQRNVHAVRAGVIIHYLDAVASRPYVAPRTALEQLVAATWADVLGLQRVGLMEDFFELGGHSLLAMRILARLGGALGRQLPLRLLFDTRSVAGLCGAIAADPLQAVDGHVAEQVLCGPDPLPA